MAWRRIARPLARIRAAKKTRRFPDWTFVLGLGGTSLWLGGRRLDAHDRPKEAVPGEGRRRGRGLSVIQARASCRCGDLLPRV